MQTILLTLHKEHPNLIVSISSNSFGDQVITLGEFKPLQSVVYTEGNHIEPTMPTLKELFK